MKTHKVIFMLEQARTSLQHQSGHKRREITRKICDRKQGIKATEFDARRRGLNEKEVVRRRRDAEDDVDGVDDARDVAEDGQHHADPKLQLKIKPPIRSDEEEEEEEEGVRCSSHGGSRRREGGGGWRRGSPGTCSSNLPSPRSRSSFAFAFAFLDLALVVVDSDREIAISIALPLIQMRC